MAETSGESINYLWSLLQASEGERSVEWHEQVATAALGAPLECLFEGHLEQGPDKLRYQMVRFPRSRQFGGVQLGPGLDHLATHLSGFAILEDDQPDKAHYVFSHGDILSLKLYGRIQVLWQTPWDKPTPNSAYSSAEVQVGAPDETMLPALVRTSLRELMRQAIGIAEPAVILCRIGDEYASDLVFNIFRETFKDESSFKWAMHAIDRFLPRHLRVRTFFGSRSSFETFPWNPL